MFMVSQKRPFLIAIEKRVLKILFAFLLFLSPIYSSALDIPASSSSRVNDYAHLLDSSSVAELESKLQAFEQSSSTQIVVVIFSSLEGENLEGFSMRLAEKWKVGQKGKDNGIILLIFKNDRKLRIEVGYGLEAALPDAKAKAIIQNKIIPYFKRGDFKGGIFSGVDSIIASTQGEYKTEKKSTEEDEKYLLIGLLFFIFLLGGAFFILYWFFKLASIFFHRFNRGVTFGSSSSSVKTGSGSSFRWGGGGGSSSSGSFSSGGGSFGGGGASGSW